MDGTSSISISQPFASMSFTVLNPATWNIVNTFGFPLYNTVANVSSLTASTITGTTMNIGGNLSTNSIVANSITIQSTTQVFGPMFTSSLTVGAVSSPPIGFNTYIVGSANITSNAVIGGNLSVSSTAVIGGSLAVGGSVTANNGATVLGNFTIQGNLTTQGVGTIDCQTLTIQSSLNVIGPATFSSNVAIQGTLQVGQSTTATTIRTSTLTLNPGGYIQLGTGTTVTGNSSTFPGQTVFAVNTPIFTPFLSTQNIQASGTVSINTLEVLSTISANTVTNVFLGSANIQNQSGSLVTSSVQTNTLILSNTLITSTVLTSNLITSNIVATGSVVALSPGAFISTGAIFTSSLQVSQISTGSIVAGTIETPSIQVSSLFVSQTFNAGPGVSSINIQTANVDNSLGSILTGGITTSSLVTSSITVQTGNVYSPGQLVFNTPAVYMQLANLSSVNTSTLNASTLTTSRITIGATPGAGSNGPNFIYNSAIPSTNVLVNGGPGDYLTPYFLSNVRPAGQDPLLPYTTTIGFTGNYFGPQTPGLVIGYTATLYWGGVTNSILSLGGGPSLYSLYGSDQTITGTLPLSSFSIVGTLYGNSAVNVAFGFQYSPNINSINSNAVIEFNNGRLNWNYALNGTTIQNSLNDMSIRNIFYYGSLNFASDPRIKEEIELADLKRCYDSIRDLPLRRYKYIEQYCSTFRVDRGSRLGFLATDLLLDFPKSVHFSDTLFPEFSKELMTIDTAQVDMAHLGTTKYLMERIRVLEEMALSLPPCPHCGLGEKGTANDLRGEGARGTLVSP